MTLESLRKFCATLPHVAEDVKWGHDLCFLIAGKMFCVASLHAKEGGRVAFKCSPEDFADYVEREGIIPAPYTARNHWVSLQRWDALRDSELKKAIQASYQLVFSKLPKKTQLDLQKRK